MKDKFAIEILGETDNMDVKVRVEGTRHHDGAWIASVGEFPGVSAFRIKGQARYLESGESQSDLDDAPEWLNQVLWLIIEQWWKENPPVWTDPSGTLVSSEVAAEQIKKRLKKRS